MLIVVKAKVMMGLSSSSNWHLLGSYYVPSVLLSIKHVLRLISHNQPNRQNAPFHFIFGPAKSWQEQIASISL